MRSPTRSVTGGYDDTDLTRRAFLTAIGACAVAARSSGQTAPPIAVRAINHMTLRVSDPARSLDWYQGLFGLPIAARQGTMPVLRVSDGPQFIALAASGDHDPSIDHICLTVDDFDADRLVRILGAHGIVASQTPGPMRVRIRMRGEAFGGALEGTPELYVQDPDGITIQLQDARYCGGAGVLGDRCLTTPEPAPTQGRLTVRDFNHVALFVSDAARSLALYDAVFGLPRTARGAVSSLRFSSNQFLGIAAVGQPSTIHHACLSVDDFDPDRMVGVLGDYGVTPRADAQAPVGPLTSYVITRTEDDGGAPGGTPEVYFTDPDGILIQLQDARYCGGAGYFGEVC